ncbi:cytoplasmic protein [Mycobacteroides abscessus]|uniref:Cytoplasmic protein n=1 Tax=Mycobacteroides abscessus TaxID=36809 RepID=A0ABD7HIP6_9MYCO|nr:cytoplasmic protein [Mycobacteroides abscessus]RIT32733.1 cytoplasmic protein [Mycobacteroides abscessus]
MGGRKSVKKAHAHSSNNRVALGRSSVCGCFYCLAIYSPSAITEWTDYDDSARCPKYGIDSVLAEDSGYPIAEGFLSGVYAHWFAIVHRVDGG